jgi:hypothetical protein
MLFFDALHDPKHPSYLSWAGMSEKDALDEITDKIPY